ncbi:MAG: ubiquitin [Metallosphaera yellowstonensis]|jgi:Ubiquitin-like protein|uniref:Ubiquitin-like protein n=1 Tax=Metallosphaera yellowstonensis MK1 TaxID=671065 RepID=H2C6R2_9CREN|nr:hypothetical protein [Metallosphaera yellowstonensis]EHP69489.1 ubiquitin-like protein [Metallosphaera yellowstonensis MK1]
MNDMVKVILRGPLSNVFGKEEIKVDADNLLTLLYKLDRGSVIISNSKIRSGYIILVNGVDFRLLGDLSVKDTDVIEILPVNHGG